MDTVRGFPKDQLRAANLSHGRCSDFTLPYLTAYDFEDEHVTVRFEDGSYLRFEYAFYMYADGALEVYTEHCGYHKFSNQGNVVHVTGVDRTAYQFSWENEP